MKNSRFLTHSPINFVFNKGSKDFTVEELPLYEFSGEGEHIVATVRKKDMTTWDMLSAISSAVGVKQRDIGYAGLKDKDGMTIQHISLPRNFEAALKEIEHPNLKILNLTKHKNKIKLGHLIGNRFFVRLKKIMPSDFKKLKQGLTKISNEGMPNYFGYQRFGRDGKNHELGKEIVYGEKRERNQNLKRFFISAYQSHLYNEWLDFRINASRLIESFDKNDLENALKMHFASKGVEIDPKIGHELKKQEQFLKIFHGDAMCHYPHGKLFNAENANEEAVRFAQKQVSPTGLLCGEKNRVSADEAFLIEKLFIDEKVQALGDRRYAWIFPYDCEIEYEEEEAHAKIKFSLPKGSYATSLLEEITGAELGGGGEDFFEE
ncbi:MAG TPA: tRNA pseudouridine(13) synthase TruD [Campylobacterales bacterium]|nr:tRNA pseudouridine(13) synthase TruD [Campylobacterales bacterium]